MKDLISVVVPVYNAEKYLNQCIESIINQTYKNLEIILVEDGCTDNSGNICDEFAKKDKRIKVIHKKNEGVSKARNIGIEESKGKYIQFIDSDDYLELDMIEFLYNNIKKYDADISMCSHYILTENECFDEGTNTLNIYNNIEAIGEILLDKKVRSYVWNKLFSADLLKEIRFPSGRIFEDLLIIPQIFAKASKIVLEDKAKYYYRQREGSILNGQNKKLRIAYINAAIENINSIREKIPSLEEYFAYNIVHITMNTFNDSAFLGMYDMLEEDVTEELYQKTCDIFNNKKYEKFLVENLSNVEKLHLYYLITDKDGYIKNNRKLPLIYESWKDNLEN